MVQTDSRTRSVSWRYRATVPYSEARSSAMPVSVQHAMVGGSPSGTDATHISAAPEPERLRRAAALQCLRAASLAFHASAAHLRTVGQWTKDDDVAARRCLKRASRLRRKRDAGRNGRPNTPEIIM